MPERARKKRTLNERRHLLRRVFLGILVVALLAGATAIIWTARHALPAATTAETPGEDAPGDRTPYGVFCAQECFFISRDGVAFKKTARPSGNLLLVIENPHASVGAGSAVLDPGVIAELMFLRRAVSERLGVKLGRAVQSRFNKEDFDIKTGEGWDLRLSTANNAYATVEILARTLEELGETRPALAYIDLRIENRVYFSTLQGGTTP